MYYLKQGHMICLDKNELVKFYKNAKRVEFANKIFEKGYSYGELESDNQKIHEIVDLVTAEGLRDKDEVEIFAALFCYLEFYPEGSRVCFVLKDGFNLSKYIIRSLQDLKNAIKEYELTDFGIFSDDGLRQFQLKRYRGRLNAEDIFRFIRDKIKHYGNQLGDINLLVVLQSFDATLSNDVFHEVHEKLKKLNLTFSGQILISYNENMQFSVINQVYPNLATTRKPFRLPSSQLGDSN